MTGAAGVSGTTGAGGAGITLQVCATAPGAFATIGAAIAAAPSGSMIEVCAGTYSEVLVVQGKLLDIRGEAAASTILDAAARGTALTEQCSGRGFGRACGRARSGRLGVVIDQLASDMIARPGLFRWRTPIRMAPF